MVLNEELIGLATYDLYFGKAFVTKKDLRIRKEILEYTIDNFVMKWFRYCCE